MNKPETKTNTRQRICVSGGDWPPEPYFGIDQYQLTSQQVVDLLNESGFCANQSCDRGNSMIIHPDSWFTASKSSKKAAPRAVDVAWNEFYAQQPLVVQQGMRALLPTFQKEKPEPYVYYARHPASGKTRQEALEEKQAQLKAYLAHLASVPNQPQPQAARPQPQPRHQSFQSRQPSFKQEETQSSFRYKQEELPQQESFKPEPQQQAQPQFKQEQQYFYY